VNSDIHYEDCPRCANSYKSVMEATLTLFQTVVTGDNWGMTSIPIIEREPWTAVVLFIVVISVSLGLMNLIVAVIVERAAEGHVKDMDEIALLRSQNAKIEKMELLKLCYSIDSDGDGLVALDEIFHAYDHVPTFASRLSMMNINRKDLNTIYKILDVDNSGDVNYREFVNHLYGLEANSPNLLFAKVQIAYKNIKGDMQNILKLLQEQESSMEHKSQRVASMNEKFNEVFSKSEKILNGANSPVINTVPNVSEPGKQVAHSPSEEIDSVILWLPPGESDVDMDHTSGALSSMLEMCLTGPEITEELGRLQLRMEDLTVLRDEIARRADAQWKTLSENAQILASTCRGSAVPQANFGQFADQVRMLQCQVFHQLPAAMEDLRLHIHQEAILLNQSRRVLCLLAEVLSPPSTPPDDTNI